MAPSGPMASRFLPRFPAQIPDRQAALICRPHLSERRGRTLPLPEVHLVPPKREGIISALNEKIRHEPASGHADASRQPEGPADFGTFGPKHDAS